MMNCLTSGPLAIWRSKIPWVAPDDKSAIQLGLRTCARPDPENARVVRIADTLHLSDIWISVALRPAAQALSHVAVDDTPSPWRFLANGEVEPMQPSTVALVRP
jgi:hypothetical protein